MRHISNFISKVGRIFCVQKLRRFCSMTKTQRPTSKCLRSEGQKSITTVHIFVFLLILAMEQSAWKIQKWLEITLEWTQSRWHGSTRTLLEMPARIPLTTFWSNGLITAATAFSQDFKLPSFKSWTSSKSKSLSFTKKMTCIFISTTKASSMRRLHQPL